MSEANASPEQFACGSNAHGARPKKTGGLHKVVEQPGHTRRDPVPELCSGWFERRAPDFRKLTSKNSRMKTNETKFTTGPWACEKTGDGKRLIIGDNQSSWGTHVGEVHRDDIDRKEAEANAALIRKAPEMFAALVKCSAHLGAEIEQKALTESAADGTQALSREVATLLDVVAAPSNNQASHAPHE